MLVSGVDVVDVLGDGDQQQQQQQQQQQEGAPATPFFRAAAEVAAGGYLFRGIIGGNCMRRRLPFRGISGGP